MSKGKDWDVTSLHSLEGAAEWIRNKSGALLVLVVRPEDVAFAVDPLIAPKDAGDMVEVAMQGVPLRLEMQRAAAKDLAAEKARRRK